MTDRETRSAQRGLAVDLAACAQHGNVNEGNFDGCFRYWESRSLGGNLKNTILQNSKTRFLKEFNSMSLSNMNSERWGSRACPCGRFAARASPSANPTPSARAHSRSAALRHSTALHMSIEVFGDATASHKSAEGRSKHYEWSQLIVVEKREAVKR